MKPIRYACLLAALTAISPVTHAVDGEYDPSWPGNGRVRLDISPGSDEAEALLVQTDGKVVIAGACGDSYCAARLLPNGSYDAGFGNTGQAGRFVQGFAGLTLRLTAAAQAADGGIVLVGSNIAGADFGVLLKLDPQGSGQWDLFQLLPVVAGGENLMNAIAVQSDGKIVVAGGGDADFLVARILADFSGLDPSFGDVGTPGIKKIAFPGVFDRARALALQRDGKIVLAGESASQAAFARLMPSGQLDDDPATGFGDGGRAVFTWGLVSTLYAIAVDRDGSLLIAGTASGNTGPNPSYDFFVNRLTTRGVQAPDFGLLCPPPSCAPGPAYFDWGNRDDVAFALALQSDGKILASGRSVRGAGGGLTELLFGVVRFDSAGNLDGTFGSGGQTRSWYGAAAGVDDAKAIVIGNGGIMIAGFSRDATTVNSRFGVAKLKLDLLFADRFEP